MRPGERQRNYLYLYLQYLYFFDFTVVHNLLYLCTEQILPQRTRGRLQDGGRVVLLTTCEKITCVRKQAGRKEGTIWRNDGSGRDGQCLKLNRSTNVILPSLED